MPGRVLVLASAGKRSSINDFHGVWLGSATSEEELAAEQYLDHKPERGAAEPELGYGQVGAWPLACLPFSSRTLVTPQVS